MSSVTIDLADDTLATLEEHAAGGDVSVSRLVAQLADHAADQVRKLRELRRDVSDADPAALRHYLDAIPDVEPEEWDQMENG